MPNVPNILLTTDKLMMNGKSQLKLYKYKQNKCGLRGERSYYIPPGNTPLAYNNN